MSNDALIVLLSVLTYIFLNLPVIQTEISFVRGLPLAHYCQVSSPKSQAPYLSKSQRPNQVLKRGI